MPDDKKLNTQEAAESNVQKEEPTLVTTEVEEDFVDSLMEKYDITKTVLNACISRAWQRLKPFLRREGIDA